jgi:hypothetical protein
MNTRKVVDTSAKKPKLPKVDKPQSFEVATRELFTAAVADWCKENIEGKVDKELKGEAVDDLVAQFGSAIDTMVTSATNCYLDAAFDDDGDDGDDDDGDGEDGEEEEAA